MTDPVLMVSEWPNRQGSACDWLGWTPGVTQSLSLLHKRSVGGATRSRWDKLRRLTKEKLVSGRRAGSLGHVTRGATACRGNYASPEHLCAPPPTQPRPLPHPLPLYTTAGGCRMCRQSSAFWEDGLYHSAPSVCGSVLMADAEELDSGDENGCPLSPPLPRRKLPYQPFSVGTPYLPACYAGVGGYRPAHAPAEPPGYGQRAHTAPPSPMHRRRAAEPDPAHPADPARPAGGPARRAGHAPRRELSRQESLDELRSTVHSAASTMERSSDDVRLLGQKMAAATEMMSESVQENAQALGLLVEVVDKLRGLIVAGRAPPYAAAAAAAASRTPPSPRRAHFLSFSSSSSSSSSGSSCVYADGLALSRPRSGLASPKSRPKNKAPAGPPPRHANAPSHLSNGLLGARLVANHSKTGCLSGKKEKKKK